MISIKRIDFLNYRIAGTCSLSFDDSQNGYHMFGIVAENGTGKTTILNGITWCLYAKEYQLKDAERALPIINSKTLKEMASGQATKVGVRVSIVDGDNEIVFDRKLAIIKTEGDDGVPIATPELQTEFVVTVADLKSSASTKSYSNEAADYYVADYFENSIHDFFFFDGERLEEFFTDQKASSIQSSVEAIAQISLLEASTKNAKQMATTLRSKVSKSRPALAKLEEECKDAEKRLLQDKSTLERLENEKSEKSDEKAEKDGILKENSASASLQAQKRIYAGELDDISNEQQELYKNKVKFAVRSATLVQFYPLIVSAIDFIEQKDEMGEQSVYLTKSQLQEILDEALKHAVNCPLCGTEIQTDQLLNLQKVIDKQTLDDDVVLTLTRIKEDLINAKEEILQFKNNYQDICIKEIELQDKFTKTEQKYSEVSEKISRLGSQKDENGNEIDYAKLEAESMNLESKIAGLLKTIGATEVMCNLHEEEFLNLQKQYEEAVSQENSDVESQKVIDTLAFIENQFESIKKSLTNEVREKLEKITKEIFMRVIKKKKTFGKICINNAYRLDLYDEYGHIMTGSSCATEYMTLAYAYTLAIHEASGHNCPLVIDYPLGRISGDIRENTAEMLLETSRNKQIIMLLTEDEYSEKVKQLYEGKAVIKQIYLAEHERSWEGTDL